MLACTIEKVGLSQTKTSRYFYCTSTVLHPCTLILIVDVCVFGTCICSGDRVWMDVHVKLLENSERRVLVVDGLLIATGRFPRVTNMGLDIAQVQGLFYCLPPQSSLSWGPL